MQLKFNLSTPELVDLYVFNNWSAPWKKKSRQRIQTLIPLGLILFGAAFLLDNQYGMGAVLIIIAALWFFLYDKVYTNRLKHFAQGYYNHEINERFWAENTYHFTPSSILMENEFIKSEIQWKGIINFIENENAFWLFESLATAHIIPKRVLSDTEQENFKRLLASKLIQK